MSKKKNGAKAQKALIPIKLTDKEIEERGRHLAGLELALAKKEEEKKAKTKEFNDAISGIKEEISKVSNVIEVGEEEQSRSVVIERGNGQVVYIDPKTKEVLHQRAMRDEELQDEMDFA